jgi:hypothetical protein
MRWRQQSLDDITAKLPQLGLSGCSVCGSADSMSALTRPVILPIGGHIGVDESGNVFVSGGQDRNILFMVGVECNLCGHFMLFHSQQFFGGDEPIIDTTHE